MIKPVGTLSPYGAPVLRKAIVANSITITENDSVKAASGFVALGTAGALVLGHVQSLITVNGMGLTTNGASADFVGTYTTASDNQTVAQVSAELDISKQTLYSADPDATIATTTGSNLLGYFTDIADEDNTDESDAKTTTAQYFIWGVDQNDSGNQIVNVYESQVFGV